MATARAYAQVADRLTQLATGFAAQSEVFASGRSSAAAIIETLDGSWDGPLAEKFLPAATAFNTTVGPSANHATQIAGALSTLAGAASRISGDLSILENADEADTAAISSKAEEWRIAQSTFRTTVNESVAGLKQVDGVGLVLPGATTDAEFAAAVIEEFGGADGVDELIRQLAGDEDVEGFQLLADTFGRSLHGLSPEGILDALRGIAGPSRHLLLMASDTLPPAITEVLLSEQYLGVIHNHDLAHYERYFSWEFLEAVTGFDVTGNPDVEWTRAEVAFWDKILNLNPESIELVAALPSDASGSGLVPQTLRIATIDHLVENPVLLDRLLSFELNITSDADAAVSNLMGVLYPADADGALNEVVAAYTAHTMDGAFVTVDDIMAQFPDIGSEEAAANMALRRRRRTSGVRVIGSESSIAPRRTPESRSMSVVSSISASARSRTSAPLMTSASSPPAPSPAERTRPARLGRRTRTACRSRSTW